MAMLFWCLFIANLVLQVFCIVCCITVSTDIAGTHFQRKVDTTVKYGDFEGYPRLTYPDGHSVDVLGCHFTGHVDVTRGLCHLETFDCACTTRGCSAAATVDTDCP